jgi:hypothetical protein
VAEERGCLSFYRLTEELHEVAVGVLGVLHGRVQGIIAKGSLTAVNGHHVGGLPLALPAAGSRHGGKGEGKAGDGRAGGRWPAGFCCRTGSGQCPWGCPAVALQQGPCEVRHTGSARRQGLQPLYLDDGHLDPFAAKVNGHGRYACRCAPHPRRGLGWWWGGWVWRKADRPVPGTRRRTASRAALPQARARLLMLSVSV